MARRNTTGKRNDKGHYRPNRIRSTGSVSPGQYGHRYRRSPLVSALWRFRHKSRRWSAHRRQQARFCRVGRSRRPDERLRAHCAVRSVRSIGPCFRVLRTRRKTRCSSGTSSCAANAAANSSGLFARRTSRRAQCIGTGTRASMWAMASWSAWRVKSRFPAAAASDSCPGRLRRKTHSRGRRYRPRAARRRQSAMGGRGRRRKPSALRMRLRLRSAGSGWLLRQREAFGTLSRA